MRKKIKKNLFILVCVIFSLVLSGCIDDEMDFSEESYQYEDERGSSQRSNISKREYYTKFKEDGEDTVTIMLYMIGSDLESGDAGCATDDIAEMAEAVSSDKVQIVLQTGGTTDWVNDNISGGTTQRFTMEEGELVLQEDLGPLCMTAPETLTNYVSWAADNYEANRNILIFWDHGGGTAMGFGSDQYYEEDSMELSEIASALKKQM